MNGQNSYKERQSNVNIGEIIFEKYCQKKGYDCRRMGFDEKQNSINNFFNLSVLLRNLPDYVVNTEKETFIVNVKGTANFKQKEIDILPLFIEWFSSKKAPLVYAFCFENKQPKLYFPERIIELYKQAHNKQWPDGVVYRTLEI